MANEQRLRTCLAYERKSSGLISGMGCLQKQNELNSGKLNAELCSLLSNGNTCSTNSLSLLYLSRNDNKCMSARTHTCTQKYPKIILAFSKQSKGTEINPFTTELIIRSLKHNHSENTMNYSVPMVRQKKPLNIQCICIPVLVCLCQSKKKYV